MTNDDYKALMRDLSHMLGAAIESPTDAIEEIETEQPNYDVASAAVRHGDAHKAERNAAAYNRITASLQRNTASIRKGKK